MISYAQNFEDVMLARALGDRVNGFYVDLGACYPDIASVTRHFYDNGWSGVNVEPMPELFARLQAERPRDINVHAAVASHSGEIAIYEGPTAGESSAFARSDTARSVIVPSLTLAELCRRHVTQPIDFLKIDVEGLELDVIQGGDWDRYRPTVLVVEVTLPWSTNRRPDAREIGDFLRDKSYDEVYFDGLNAFFLARESASLAPRFSAPANVLDRFTSAHEAELLASTAAFRERAETMERRLAEVAALAVRSDQVGNELRETIAEKERLLLEAQRAWQVAVQAAERLQPALESATRDLRAAELRVVELTRVASEAASRAEAAIAAARSAESRAQAAETAAMRANTQAVQAEASSREANARAQHALVEQASASLRAERAETNAFDQEARRTASQAAEQDALRRALQAEHTMASMLRSRSWRITAGLRALGDIARGRPKSGATIEAGSTDQPETVARSESATRQNAARMLARTMLWARQSPRIVSLVLWMTERHPGAWSKLKRFAHHHARDAVRPTSAALLGAPASAGVPPVSVSRDLSAAVSTTASDSFARSLAEEVRRQRGGA